MGLFAKDFGIDLGTANTLILERGKGIILREPSVVAVNERTKKVIAVGEKAKRMIGKTPETIRIIRPLKDGVIADYQSALQMIKLFIRKATGRRLFRKPRMIICVPSGVTQVERKAVIEIGLKSGAREVFIAEESVMAAVGAGLPVNEPTGNMVVDIGGGTTEIAVISLGSIVASTTLKLGGDVMDEAIIRYIRKKYRVFIGSRTAEDLKMKIGAVVPRQELSVLEIRGRNLTQGLPVNLTITTDEIIEALSDLTAELLDGVRRTLEVTPPELASDIMINGIVLTGGGALLHGIDRFLSENTGNIPVMIADDPLDCVVLGTGAALENIEYIEGNK